MIHSTLSEVFRLEVQMPARAIFLRRNGTPVPLSGEAEFAAYSGARVCLSRAGRWRPAHDWDRDGLCLWCYSVDQVALQGDLR